MQPFHLLLRCKKLCSIIEKWNLTQFDVKADNGSTEGTAIGDSSKGMANADCPFKVKVTATDLNIRKGAGTNYDKTGKYTGADVFTIVKVKEGKGSAAGWGKLKSGAGWIALSYCTRV